MDDFPLQDITIFHKEGASWERYIVKASFRNTSIINRNKNGVTNGDNALIRVFDATGYNNTWKAIKGDIIVNTAVNDDIIETPLTILQKKYGNDNVYQIKSIDKFIFGFDLDHIKIGAI